MKFRRTYWHPRSAARWFAAILAGALVGLGRATPPPTDAPAAIPATASVAPFQAGDRWAAIGDSITHTGFYTRYIYLFCATRFPDRPLDFFNCGSAGDTAKGTVARLQKDILRHHPTVATIMLGMNDVRRGFYASKFDAPDAAAQREAALALHFASMRALAEQLRAADVRMVFLTPSPFDDTAEFPGDKYSGVNAALGRCAENVRALAVEFHAPVVDFHGPMTRLNRELQQSNPEFTLVGSDRIHPKEPGGLVMAYLFLKAMGVSPFVADITEDARGRSELSFTCRENALPFPVPPECLAALDWIPFTQELNQERLQVTHLPEGRYRLAIDGQPVGTFAAAELAAGINLATFSGTPQARQAEALAKLDAQRYALVQILRTLDFFDAGMNPNYGVTDEFDYAAAVAKRKPSTDGWGRKLREDYMTYKPRQAEVRKQLNALVDEIRRANQPRPLEFTLRRE
jgi:lysophospholipase L1-like esterase